MIDTINIIVFSYVAMAITHISNTILGQCSLTLVPKAYSHACFPNLPGFPGYSAKKQLRRRRQWALRTRVIQIAVYSRFKSCRYHCQECSGPFLCFLQRRRGAANCSLTGPAPRGRPPSGAAPAAFSKTGKTGFKMQHNSKCGQNDLVE